MNSELALFKGIPSAYSLGFDLTSPTDPAPDVLILNSDSDKAALRLVDEGAHSNWRPTTPALKNGGVWTESNTNDGRSLVSAPLGNVTETLRLMLVNPEVMPKAEIMTQVLRLIDQCRAYHTSEFQTAPVYLGLQYAGAPGAQYALVYNLEVDMQIDPYIEENQSFITLAIEREPTWRGVPPGGNPKLWGFYKKGWQPSSQEDIGESENIYNHQLLSFQYPLTGHTELVDGSVYPFDEIATPNVNYIDIPASLIDGDVPADALITFKGKTNGVSKLHIARDTRVDLYPGNNNNTVNQRQRRTFNGGDCTIVSGNPTVTKVIDATGVLSNASIVNRYILQLVYAAGTTSTTVATWSRVISQYPGRYAAFLRAQVTAGTVTATKFFLQWATGASNINLQTTNPVYLNQNGYGLTYLGEVDFTLLGSKYTGFGGTGIDVNTTFDLRLSTTKTSAETPTIKIWDLVLMPVDEPNGLVVINFAALAVNDYASLDKTSYFSGGRIQDAAITLQVSTLYQRRMTGQAISLIPGVTNRLYFLPDVITPSPTVPHEVQVSIVPRWAGLRDV